MNKCIAITIYANPDGYPPTVNAIHILSQEFDVVVIARNQNEPKIIYPDNVHLYRLGKLKTAHDKETQPLWIKIWEYFLFILRAIWIVRRYKCRLIYSYDMHGFLTGFLASRTGKKIPLIYHNHDLAESEKMRGLLSYYIKRFELRFARYANKVVFPEVNRAKIFKKEAGLCRIPDIVMNTPLRRTKLPKNCLGDILSDIGVRVCPKIILYHGSIGEGRCILEIVKSIIYWPSDSFLILLGTYYGNIQQAIHEVTKDVGINNRIICLPQVPYSRLFSYVVGADLGIGLFKSININLINMAGASNKLFEYMALGIPFVTNETPEFQRLFAPFGAFFADPNSPESIGKAVSEALKVGNRPIEAAREAHLTKYNYETQFQPVLEYIRSVISE